MIPLRQNISPYDHARIALHASEIRPQTKQAVACIAGRQNRRVDELLARHGVNIEERRRESLIVLKNKFNLIFEAKKHFCSNTKAC